MNKKLLIYPLTTTMLIVSSCMIDKNNTIPIQTANLLPDEIALKYIKSHTCAATNLGILLFVNDNLRNVMNESGSCEKCKSKMFRYDQVYLLLARYETNSYVSNELFICVEPYRNTNLVRMHKIWANYGIVFSGPTQELNKLATAFISLGASPLNSENVAAQGKMGRHLSCIWCNHETESCASKTSTPHSGDVSRGWLGVAIQDLTGEMAEYYELKDQKGVLVADVFKGDPADEAGIKPKDIILEVNDKKIETSRQLTNMIAGLKVDEATKVRLFRNDKFLTFYISIGKRYE